MNTAKLLNVLQDIKSDEESLKIQTKLEELKSSVSANQIENTEDKRKEILDLTQEASTNELTKSSQKIIAEINGTRYVGQGIAVAVEEMLSTDAYKIVSRLEEYIRERRDFFQTINNLITNLEKVSIEAHFQKEDFEVGILLPESFSEIKDLQKALGDFDEFLKVVSEITGEQTPNKIVLVSEGCWEFFVLKGVAAAKAIDVVLNKLADFYLKIQKIQQTGEEIKFLKNKNIESELNNERKKLANEMLDTIVTELLKGYKQTDTGRKNELKNGLKARLKQILKLIDKGAELEVVKPYADVDSDGEGEDGEKKITAKDKELLEVMKSLDKTNTLLKQIEIQPEVLLLEDVWKSEAETEDADTSKADNTDEATK